MWHWVFLGCVSVAFKASTGIKINSKLTIMHIYIYTCTLQQAGVMKMGVRISFSPMKMTLCMMPLYESAFLR